MEIWRAYDIIHTPIGEVPEWLNGAVSKTVVALVVTVGSNPTLSAESGSRSEFWFSIIFGAARLSVEYEAEAGQSWHAHTWIF